MKTLAALAFATLLLSACPGNEVSKDYAHSGPSKASDAATRNPQASPGNSAKMNPTLPPRGVEPKSDPVETAGSAIDVQLTEYEIRMPSTLPAGRTTLLISAAGKESHGLVVEGNGYHAALPEPLARGDRATLQLDLKPGTYSVYCPVDEHKAKGMSLNLTVK